jgi:hypothetical protein
MRALIAAALATGITFAAGTSAAQQPGSTFATTQSRFVLSAERLFGLSFTRETHENIDPGDPTTETKTSTTNIGLGTNVFYYSPYVQPQLGFDVFVIDHLSVGGALSYFTVSGESEETGEASNDVTEFTLFRVTPRVGYGMMFTDLIGLWARGGLTYYNQSTESEGGTKTRSTVAPSRSRPY